MAYGKLPGIPPKYLAGLAEWNGIARAFLFSGGGNDLVGRQPDGISVLTRYIRPHTAGRSPAWHLESPDFACRLAHFEACYRHVIADVATRYPNLPIIIHGYDYPLPCPFDRDDRRQPRWISRDAYFGSSFPHVGIRDVDLQVAILRKAIDAMNAIQRRLAGGNVPGGAFAQVFHVDLRGTLHTGNWADEIHPTNTGFAKVSERFRRVLRSAGVN